jgi:hypothetical protein
LSLPSGPFSPTSRIDWQGVECDASVGSKAMVELYHGTPYAFGLVIQLLRHKAVSECPGVRQSNVWRTLSPVHQSSPPSSRPSPHCVVPSSIVGSVFANWKSLMPLTNQSLGRWPIVKLTNA